MTPILLRMSFIKTLVFLMVLFFSQPGTAIDTYGLDDFFKSYEPVDQSQRFHKQKKKKGEPHTFPLENIRIGYLEINFSRGLEGDNRLIEHSGDDFILDELNLWRLLRFYFNYIDRGDYPDQRTRQQRLQRVFSLIFHIFQVNINNTTADNQLANASQGAAIYNNLFLNPLRNGNNNPYYHYFDPSSAAAQSQYQNVNNGFVLFVLSFTAPMWLMHTQAHPAQNTDSPNINDIHNQFDVLQQSFTGKSYSRALQGATTSRPLPRATASRPPISADITSYSSPEEIARIFLASGLSSETVLLVSLRALTIGGLMHQLNPTIIHWPATYQLALRAYMTTNLLPIIISRMFSSILQILGLAYQGLVNLNYETISGMVNQPQNRAFRVTFFAANSVWEQAGKLGRSGMMRLMSPMLGPEPSGNPFLPLEDNTARGAARESGSEDEYDDYQSDYSYDGSDVEMEPDDAPLPEQSLSDQLSAARSTLVHQKKTIDHLQKQLQKKTKGSSSGGTQASASSSQQGCCGICYEPMTNIMGGDCGHFGFCQQCVDALKTDGDSGECPTCREKVKFKRFYDQRDPD